MGMNDLCLRCGSWRNAVPGCGLVGEMSKEVVRHVSQLG